MSVFTKFDPELAAALRSDPRYTQPPPPPPAGASAIEYARKQASALYGGFTKYYGERLPQASAYIVEDKRIPVDGGEITVRIVRPTSAANATFPALVWYHGGAWALGDLDWDDHHLRTISVDLQLAIVNVDYRLAPEHPFPTPFNDCYSALKWVVDNALALNISVRRGLLVGGDSAGANLAAAVALTARDDPSVPLTGQYLREAPVKHPLASVPEQYKTNLRSYEENKDAAATLMNSALLALDFMKLYGAPPEDLRISPLLAQSHAGLAPAFIQVMELDTLRDEDILYEAALREAGVSTKLALYPGVPHGFHYSFPGIAAAAKVVREELEGLSWLLSLTDQPQ